MIITEELLNNHTVAEISEMLFKEMSVYHHLKLSESLNKASGLAEQYATPKKDPAISGSVELGYGDRARKLVQDELDDWKELGYLVHFIVDRSHRFVKVELINIRNNRVEYSAFSTCRAEDDFNVNVGKMIALYRANYGDAYKEELDKVGFGHLFE